MKRAAFCWLLIFATLSYGSILETHSWVSSIQTRDTLLQAATVVTTFGEETYISLGCPDAKPVALGSCVAGSGTQSAPLCASLNRQSFTFAENVTDTWVRGTANLDLAGLAITATNARGKPTVTITAGSYSHLLLKDEVLVPFSFCRAELLQKAGATWNGVFNIKISSDRSGSVDILIPADVSALPLDPYYSLAKVSLVCPFDLLPCVYPYCQQNIKPTSDPFFSYYFTYYTDQINRDDAPYLDETVVPNTLATVFNIEIVQRPAKVATYGSGIGIDAIDTFGHLDSQCRVIYANLREGSPTAAIAEVSNVVTPKQPECNNADFKAKVALWDDVIVALDEASSKKYTTSQTYSYVNLAHTIASSQGWAACRELAGNYLDSQRFAVVDFTEDCLTPPGSPEWNTDPCCNLVLQKKQCCAEAPYNVFKTNYAYKRDIHSLTQSCVYPYCADTILRNYENVIGNSESCSEESDKANSDPRFSSNPYNLCFVAVFGKKCFFPSQCSEIPGSKCDTSRASCTVPCSADNPCYRGTCQPSDFGNVCILSDAEKTQTFDAIFPSFTNCIFGEIDPYLATLIRAEVEVPGSAEPFSTQFQKRITSPTCVDPVTSLLPWLPPHPKTESACNSAQKWCDWQQCFIPSQCSEAQCTNPLPAPDFCVFDLGSYLKLPFGNPAVCEVSMLDTLYTNLTFVNKDPTLCTLMGALAATPYLFVGVPNTNYQAYSSCIRPGVVTDVACYNKHHCINNLAGSGLKCPSWCKLNLDATRCNAFRFVIPGANGQFAQGIYTNWISNVDGSPQQACVVVGMPHALCINLNNVANALLPLMGGAGVWQPGYRMVQPKFSSPTACTGVCYDGIDTFYDAASDTKDECESTYTCTSCVLGTEPTCNNRTLCEQSYTCDNPSGCIIFPQYLVTLPYDVPCVYSPLGCITPLTKPQCDLSNRYRGDANIKWQFRFTDEKVCATNSYICRLATTPANVTYVGTPSLPAGFSERNKTECEACGGTYEPYFKWTRGQWVRKNTWLDLTWAKKAASQPKWTSQINEDAFLQLLETSRGQRLANILIGELFCNYGTERELFQILSCNCGTGQSECELTSTTAELTLSGMSACVGVPGSISTRWITTNPLLFKVGDDFAIGSGEICVKVSLSTVPLELLQEEESVTLSSLFITSESNKKSNLGKQFIYNTQDPPVVSGQLIDDGVGFDFDVNGTVTGFVVCVEFPTGWDDWRLRLDPHYKTVVVANKALDEFKILPLNLPLNTKEFCHNLTEDVIIFPAIVIEDWETLELKNSWPSEELGFDIALAVLYAILFIICFGSLGFNFFLTFVKKENTKTLGDFLALIFLFVLTILRTIYFSGVPSGEWESSFALVIIFGDLPALLFLGAVILTGNKWGQIYYTSRKLGTDDYEKKNKILAAVAGFLIITIFIIFVILSAIYGAEINNIAPTTCQDPPKDGISYVEAISLVYKCIFAFYCMMTAVFFGFFGGSFVKLVFDFTQKGEKEARTRKFLLVTTICVLALLALSAILIASTRIFFNNMAKFAIILCTEWFPISGLCFLYGMQNFNRKAAKDATQATNRTKQSTTKN